MVTKLLAPTWRWKPTRSARAPLDDLRPPRQPGEQLERRERDVQEEADRGVGPQGAHHRRHELQVVVVHPDDRVGRGDLGEPVGESLVDGDVGVPLRRRGTSSRAPRRGTAARASRWRTPRSSRRAPPARWPPGTARRRRPRTAPDRRRRRRSTRPTNHRNGAASAATPAPARRGSAPSRRRRCASRAAGWPPRRAAGRAAAPRPDGRRSESARVLTAQGCRGIGAGGATVRSAGRRCRRRRHRRAARTPCRRWPRTTTAWGDRHGRSGACSSRCTPSPPC